MAIMNESKQNMQSQSPTYVSVPGFSRKAHGYDTRQVDAYIDQLLAENHELSRANHQFLLLYLNGEISGIQGDDGENALDKAKINHLLMQFLEQQARDPYEDMDISIAELAGLQKKRSRFGVSVFGIFFYVILAGFILASYWFGGEISSGPPRNIAGFSAMVVLSRSMQHDIPQDSLILTRQTDPGRIRVGDDITFLGPDNMTITHRVVNIHPNYEDSGMRGFETAGTANAQRDEEVVLAEDIVGRVIFHSVILGRAALFIRTNILLVSIFAVVTIGMITILRSILFRGEKH